MAELDIPITVTGLQGRPIATTAPADGQALSWSAAGNVWTPVTPPFLPLSGGSLTGNLNVVGNLTASGAVVFSNTVNVNPGPVTVASANATYGAAYNYNNTNGPGITSGNLWQTQVLGGYWAVNMNTAAAGDFSTVVNPLYMSSTQVSTTTGVSIRAPGGFLNSGGTNIVTGKAITKIVPPNFTTTSNSYVMFGADVTFTPQVSGIVLVLYQGTWLNTTVGSQVVGVITYGTGTPPSRGAAGTGTQISNAMILQVENGNAYYPTSISGAVVALSLGTTYWFDLACNVNNGTGYLNQDQFIVVEL
jgi:hypothetical protein